jgi:uncharacterized protein (DUF2141 family)
VNPREKRSRARTLPSSRAKLLPGAAALLASLAVALAASADEGPAMNVIEFKTFLRSSGGVVRCGLFDEKGWLKDALRADVTRATGTSAVCVFRNVRPGTLGISAFHDVNENGKLDTNFVGYPIEDYCASNNARNTFSAPDFATAKFKYQGGQKRLEARMK